MPPFYWLVLFGLGNAPEAVISVQTFKFRPDTLVVAAGTRVTWTNVDEVEHTVSSDSAGDRFEGVLGAKGTTYGRAFAKAGVYTYHCGRHEFMRGVVRVTSPGAKP